MKHLVWGYTMVKRILMSLMCALLGVFLITVITVTIGHFFGPLYKSEDDMSRKVTIYLSVCSLFAILGGVGGFYVEGTNIKSVHEEING